MAAAAGAVASSADAAPAVTYARLLQQTYRDTGTFADYADDLTLFFMLQIFFFLLTPCLIMSWRLLVGWKRGLLTVLEAPIGRHGNRRSPAAALRFSRDQSASDCCEWNENE